MSAPFELVPQRHGGALRPFQKGVSGNPGGRPKGLMARVQRKCGRDGRKLVDGLYLLAFGTPDERREFFGEPVEITTKDRRAAIEALLDRGWGRPFAPKGEDDVPVVVNNGPNIIVNIPRPEQELAGRTVVTNALDVEPRRA